MILKPNTIEQLTQLLGASQSGKIERVDLSALNRVVQYTPEDMVVTAEAGITLAALQAELARHRQWLPLDPPHPERLTIGELINANLSGPRRFGCGTVRDHLIGIKVALADGTVISSGGKVVKNVAGYDLAKLFIGGRSSLGIVIEATFKLRPLPELERFVEASCPSLEEADRLIEAVIKSEVTPVVLDLHNGQAKSEQRPVNQSNSPSSALRAPSPPVGAKEEMGRRFTVVLGFAGTREEVEWQLARAGEHGFTQPSSLDYAAKFWDDTNAIAHRLSVLPSKMVPAIRGLNDASFIARAGNGVIYHRGAASPHGEALPTELMRRLKDAYDPRHILPDLPL